MFLEEVPRKSDRFGGRSKRIFSPLFVRVMNSTSTPFSIALIEFSAIQNSGKKHELTSQKMDYSSSCSSVWQEEGCTEQDMRRGANIF
jgi:hypothetical protein